MATFENSYTANPVYGYVKRIRWAAILAGALVMLVVLMLLNLLGIGIGLTTIDPVREQQPLSGLGTGALIWWIASNLIAIFAGGFLAAKLAGMPGTFNSIIHGFLSWCLFTLVSAWLLTTSVGRVISGVGSVLSQSISALTSAVNVPVGGTSGQNGKVINISNLSQDLNTSFALGDQRGAEVTLNEVRSVVSDAFISNGALKENVSRQEVYNAVQQNTDLRPGQAQELTDALMTRYQQVQDQFQQLEQTSAQIAESTGKAAIWTFIALLVGAITAAIAGKVGEPKRVLETV